MNSIIVMGNLAYQLDTLRKRKPQLRDYLRQVVACLVVFSLLLIDMGRPSPLWVLLSGTGRPSYARKIDKDASKLHSSQGLCFSFYLLLPALTSLPDELQPGRQTNPSFLTWFWSVFILNHRIRKTKLE